MKMKYGKTDIWSKFAMFCWRQERDKRKVGRVANSLGWIYLSWLQCVFFQIMICICLNCTAYFSKLKIIFVWISKYFTDGKKEIKGRLVELLTPLVGCICLNCNVYFPKLKKFICPNFKMFCWRHERDKRKVGLVADSLSWKLGSLFQL